MGRTIAGFATRVGLGLTFSGIVLFLTAIGAMNGRIVLPASVIATLFLGSLPLALFGIAVGVRYGNLERVSPHFDEETGRIEGHAIGRVMNPLARDNTTDAGAAGQFVPSRPLVVVTAFVPPVCIPGVLSWAPGIDTSTVWFVAVVLFVGSVVGVIAVEHRIEEVSEDDG